MISSTRIVEQIKRILRDPEGFSEESMRQLASDYAAACESLNDRMTEAASYLEAGFYCEAYRLVKQENIVEEYQTLFFEQYDDWRAVCRQFQFDLGTPISDDNSMKLQEFLLRYEPNKALFDRNRRLAFADAPASERLDTLYQLAAIFPEGRAWGRSIVALEERRDREIAEQVRRITPENADEAQARKMLDELENPARIARPNDELVNKLRAILAYLFDEERKAELSELADAWQDARSLNDERASVEYLAQYRDFSTRYAAKFDDYYFALTEEQKLNVEGAIDYSQKLELRDRRDEEVRRRSFELENLIDSGASSEELVVALDRLDAAVAATGRVNAPKIADVARNRIDEIATQKRRKTFAIAVLTALCLAAFAVAVALVVQMSAFDKKAAQIAQEAQELSDRYNNGDVAAAQAIQKLIERVPAKMNDMPDVVKARDMAETIAKSENRRHKLLAEKSEALNQKHEKGLSDASAIAELSKLAKTDEELDALNALTKRDNELRNSRVKMDSKQFETQMMEIKSAFDEIKNDADLSADEALQKLATVERKLNALASYARGANVSPDLENTRKALANAVDLYKRSLNEEGADAVLANYVGNLREYRENVERNARRYGVYDDSNALVEALNAAENVEHWNEFVSRNGDKFSVDGDKSEVDALRSYLNEHESVLNVAPEYASAKEFCAASSEKGASGSYSDFLAKLVDALDEYKEPYYTLYHEENEHYYYLEKKIDPNDDSNQYRASLDASKLRPFNPDFMNAEDVESEALQYRLYKIASDAQTGNVDMRAWNSAVAEILNVLVQAPAGELDPVLKHILLQKILAAIASDPQYNSFNDWRDALAKNDKIVGSLDFYKQDADYQDLISDAKITLKEMNERTLKEKLPASDASSSVGFTLSEYRWIGFVDVQDSEPEVVFGDNLSDEDRSRSGELFTIDSLNKLKKCGSVESGKAALDDWVDLKMKQFPVYVKIEK